jgi:NAD-dependent SIR2 family protein deacetylase
MKRQPLKHKTPVAPVDCIRCHEKKGWNPNTIHYAISDSLIPPKCQDCQGSHYLNPLRARKSDEYEYE